jgi:molybdopterin molybdotransferase
MLAAQAVRAGGVPRVLGIARDDRNDLLAKMREGLQADVLVLSGGVSAGKLDLVPDLLKELGVSAHFHKVAMKPGKPAFFGTRGQTVVFGLPGNPVSSFVCFELFVRPAVRLLGGQVPPVPPMLRRTLKEDFAHSSDRPTYHPAWCEETDAGRAVQPVAWLGSPDLRALTRANCLMLFPVGQNQFKAGEMFPVLKLE